MSLRKTRFACATQDISVLRRETLNSLQKKGYFKEYSFTPEPGRLYFTTRAISARVNRNYDGFPSLELKKAHKTFVGRPYFVNHVNMDYRRTRGIIVGSMYKENKRDKYIELLVEVDAKAFPRLAKEISNGNLDGVSMGVDVEKTKCSFCNNIAMSQEDFCDHIRYMKGQVLESDEGTPVLVYESCYGLNFFELSSVFDPADETALVQEVLLPKMAHTKVAYGEATAPPQVDTLREEGNCPQCGDDDFNGANCAWCGYNAPPDELQDPDLDQAKQIDRGQDQDQTGIPNEGEGVPDEGGSDEGMEDTAPQSPGAMVIDELAQISDAITQIQTVVDPLGAEQAAQATDMGPESDALDAPVEDMPGEDMSGQNASNDIIPEENVPGQVPPGQEQPGQAMPDQGVPADQAPMAEEMPPEGDVENQPDLDPIERIDQNLEGVDDQLAEISDAINQIQEAVGIAPAQPAPETQPDDDQEPDKFKQSAQRKRVPTLSTKRRADLSQNVAPNNDDEAAAKTPAAESGTSSTEAERNGQDDRTNVQDLDSDSFSKEEVTKPDVRENVEVKTISVAKVSDNNVKLGPKEINMIFARCDGHYADLDLGTAIAKASHDYAQHRQVSAKSVLLQALISAHQRRNELSPEDQKSLSALGNKFILRIKAEGTDILNLMNNTKNLEVAKPDDRVDVEAPVENDTNDYAQASQPDADKYDNNAGVPIADPDDVHTMNWAPGEKPKQSSTHTATMHKASAVDAIKLAESYIDLGVISADLKFEKIAEFENLPKVYIQQQQMALDAVKRAVLSHNGNKPRGVVSQTVNGHRPVPQMGRAAGFRDTLSSVDDDMFLAL